MNEAQLRAALAARFPNILVIADQYRQEFPTLGGIGSIRYALGLLGDSVSDADYNQILALIVAAETGAPIPTTGGQLPASGLSSLQMALLVGAGLLIVSTLK
jgi:hypothetical protein